MSLKPTTRAILSKTTSKMYRPVGAQRKEAAKDLRAQRRTKRGRAAVRKRYTGA